jgi:hypothetical protein
MIKASKPGSFPLFQPEFIWVSAFSTTILNASLMADSLLILDLINVIKFFSSAIFVFSPIYMAPGQALFLNQQWYESVVTDGTMLNFLHNRLPSDETADILCQRKMVIFYHLYALDTVRCCWIYLSFLVSLTLRPLVFKFFRHFGMNYPPLLFPARSDPMNQEKDYPWGG